MDVYITAPIESLPPELLIEIFLHAVAPKEYRALYTAFSLSQVSAYWRQLALRTPRLWTIELPINVKKHSKDYTATTQMLLERSSPLPISFSLGYRHDLLAKPMSPALADAIVSVASRWKDFTLEEIIIPALARHPLDNLACLESLSLYSFVPNDSATAVSLLLQAPRLRQLALGSIFMYDMSGLLHVPCNWKQLTDLRIAEDDPQNCLAIIMQCTNLCDASITIEPWEDAPPTSMTKIATLPFLKNLVLDLGYGCADGGPTHAPLFQSLALPALKSLAIGRIDSHNGCDYDLEWPRAMSNALTLFLARCPNIKHLSLCHCEMDSEQLHAILSQTSLLTALRLNSCRDCFDDYIVEKLTYTPGAPLPLAPRLQKLEVSATG